jgi:hypothetical protein
VQAGGRKTHKVRRFGSLDELFVSSDANEHDGVPLQQLQRHAEDTTPPNPMCSRNGGASVVHEEPDLNSLLALLMDTVLAKTNAVPKRLLLDFFVEVKVEQRHTLPRDRLLPRKTERLGDGGEILAAARGWMLDGTGGELWSLEDVLRGGEAVVVEMERGRRWMQVAEEEREVGVVVAGLITDQLVDEVVRDFLV